MRRTFGLFALISGLSVFASPLFAADYAVPTVKTSLKRAAGPLYIDRGPHPYCGPRCGCPIVVQVRHRTLVQAYPSNFDPRTRDEPNYHYGAARTYVRYADPVDPERVLQY